MRSPWNQNLFLGQPIDWTHPLSQGLQNVWPFTAGGGNRLPDAAGRFSGRTDGLFAGTEPARWAGRGARGCRFNGSDQYFHCGTDGSFDSLTTAMTLCVWLQPRITSVQLVAAKSSGVGVANTHFWLFLSTGPATLEWGVHGTDGIDYYIDTATIYKAQERFCLVCTCDVASDMRVYKNGVLKNTAGAPPGIHTSTQELCIGQESTAGPGIYGTFDGNIESVFIYNRALLPAEVKQFYTDTYGMFRPRRLTRSAAVPAALYPPFAHRPTTLQAM